MSAVQAGGGKGQKPGSTAGGRPASGTKPSPSARGANGAGKAPGRRPAPATKTGSGGGAGGGGGGKGPKQPGGYRPGAQPQRFSPSTLAFAAVAVVVVVVVVFVVIKVTSSNKPASAPGVHAAVNVPAQASVLDAVTNAPTSVANAVGVPSSQVVSPPTVKTGQPPLIIAGKPGAVFIGGEFCPYCAAERWAIIMAFSKFGTFSNLKETTSSPWDTDPSTPTFSFYGSTYSSPYITLNAVEHNGNDVNGVGTSAILEPLTKQESTLWQTYDNSSGFPFMDIGNKALVTTPSYVPTVLAGLDQQDVASKLTNPKDPVTQSIVGTANYLTASICATTGQKPASVCSVSAVTKAARAMGLG
ncbi:MAG TPA: DUF929 family protein [Acidimicrobiales bacterium]|nr:DUF929 family protein [Acidimicrobiales bacterium]